MQVRNLLALVVLSICSINSVRADDLTNLILTMAQESPSQYQTVMDKFIAAAKTEDVDAMLALTSPATREQQGDEALKELYRKEYLVMFSTLPTVSEGGSAEYVDDQKGTVGWIFTKSIGDDQGRSIDIYVVTLKEGADIYVSSLGIKQP